MKKIKIIVLIIIHHLLILNSEDVKAQFHPILGGFTALESNNQAILSWQILEGNTCNGIKIFRSLDSINFSQIGEIAGICGSSSAALSYSFTDTDPAVNTVNYYRLELGNLGITQTISIEIINFDNYGYQIRPNPASNFTKIYFENDNNKIHYIKVYNHFGIEIFSNSGSTNFFELSLLSIPSGNCFFIIYDSENNSRTKGKFIIQH